MSTTIDQKVVEMRFDNKNFESNVSTTMSTLDKLKSSLKLDGAAKGLENVSSAASNCNLSPLSNAAETVKLKFSALQVMATTALANITNAAVNAGKRIVSALTIDPIKTGFSEYETQINAIQTILANTESKGTTLDDVNGALDELNTYADKTIYNFTEMTRNIGTFTAAGVDLDTSVSAIKGIANLAAVSGSNSQQASTAMYQLSQALASGTVKLMDWNSVVNAGMGGQVFQDALKETARVHGIAIDDLIKKEGSFRETLSSGWLSSEILTETLAKFTGDLTEEQLKTMGYTDEQIKGIVKMGKTANDAATKVKTFTQLFDTLKEAAQSGWTQTWEIIVGDFEEAKAMLTKVSDTIGGIIGASAEARNELFENWKVLGGRTALIDAIKNAFEGVLSIIKPIKEAFREIFPPLTAEQLVGFTEGLRDLMAQLKLSDETSDKLKRTFNGLFAAVDIVRQIFVAVVKAVASLFGVVGDLGGGVLSVTATFGDWIVKLNEFLKKSDTFGKVFQGIASAIKIVVKAIGHFIGVIKDNIILPILERVRERFSGISDAAGDMTEGIANAFSGIGNAIASNPLFKLLKSILNAFKIIGSGIVKIFGNIASNISEKLDNADFDGLLDLVNGIISGGIGVAIIKFINSLSKPLESLADIGEGFSDIIGGLGDCLKGFQMKLKADALLKIAIAIAVLAASLLVLSLIDSQKLNDALGAITMLFAELMGSMAIFTKISGNFTGVTKACTAMISMSVAVLILASALKTIGGLDFDEMATGLIGIAGLLSMLVVVVKTLGSGEKTVIKGAMQMILLAAAIKILASACADLGYLDWEALAKGLLGVGILMAEVSLFTTNTQSSGKMFSTCAGILLLAAAIKILASACYDFGLMNWEDIAKGLSSVGILLLELAAFVKMTGGTQKVLSIGVALIAISAAMKILASATEDLASLSWEEIAKGLIAMAGSLAAVVVALKLMPTNMVSTGVGLIAVASSLLIIASALNKMGSMTWEEIAKGLITLGGAMLILCVGLRAMSGTLSGSAALLVAAIGLGTLAPVLVTLGSMSWGSIAKGLITVAAAIAILGVSAHLLSPIVPEMLAVAAATALIGVGLLAAGIGVTALGAGLSSLAVGLVAVLGALGAASITLSEFARQVVFGAITGAAQAVIALGGMIKELVPVIKDVLIVLITALCEVLVECVPVLVDTVLYVVVKLLESLVEYLPKIIDALIDLIVKIVIGLGKGIPKIIVAIMEFIGLIFSGIIDALNELDAEVLLNGIKAVGMLALLMVPLASVSALLPAAMLGVLGIGAIIAELSIVLAAIGALSRIPGLEDLIEDGGGLLEKIGNAIGSFVGGLAGGLISGVTSQLPQVGSDLSSFMTNLRPFIEGARELDSSLLDGVKSIVGIVLALTGANIVDSLTSWFTGGSSLAKFGAEIAEFGPHLKSYADSVSGIDPAAVQSSAAAAKALAEMASVVPNEGGMVAWFTGENSIAKFGTELVTLGQGLKSFANETSGINTESMIAAANAAKVLADMTATIPNQGGMVAWFTGDNSVANFGFELGALGRGLKNFSEETAGVNPETMVATANAAKALADMTATLPNEGGIVVWFAGDNSVAKFASELVTLGRGLKGFSNETEGINPETMTAAASAAKTLAEMTAAIPNEGGMVVWFAGDNSVSKWAPQLVTLGKGLKGFSEATNGINPESVTSAANAAKVLAELTNSIPNEGGVVAWFSGEKSLSKFGNDLIALGKGLKGFSEATVDVKPETMTAAANAAKALAEMSQTIPNEGGIAAWFAGEKSVAKFGDELVALGKGIKGFSDETTGVKPETITAASNAAKSLGEMTSVVPDDTSKIVGFGKNLTSFGSSLGSYYKKVSEISSDSITNAKNAVESVKDLGSSIDADKVKSAAKAIDDLVDSLKDIGKVNSGTVSEFKKALSELGKTSVDSLIDAFDGVDKELKDIGKEAISAFIDGIKDKTSAAKKACQSLVTDSSDAASEKASSFESAGKQVVTGFANGISANTFKAEAKARAMAKAALEAAEDELGIQSPSKEFYKDGAFAGQGFVNALDDYGSKTYKAGAGIAKSAKKGLSEAISKIADFVSGDMDMQPTIRPVLDLSDVRSGAGTIGSLFNSGSIGVATNVGAISAMMNRRDQNGTANDIVSAIDKLRDDIDGMDRASYNINGLTYSGDSELEAAFQTIIRAVKMDRRT